MWLTTARLCLILYFKELSHGKCIKFSLVNDSFFVVLVLITFLSNLLGLKRLVFRCCKITFEEISFVNTGDGKITFEELVVSIVKRKETKDKDSELQKLFQNFDSDGDGALNKGELIALLGSIQEKVSATDIDEILADFDENETGLMQYNGKKFPRLKYIYNHISKKYPYNHIY